MKKIIFTLLFLTFFINSNFSQSKSDSLLLELKNTKEDTTKALIYIELANCFINSDPKKAINYCNKSIRICNKTKFDKGTGKAYITIGQIYRVQGKYYEAIENLQKALGIFYKIEYLSGIANVYNAIGGVYYFQSNYEKTLEYLLKSLKIYEEMSLKYPKKDLYKRGIASVSNNIGIIYETSENMDKALEFYEYSLDLFQELKLEHECSNILTNIGLVYFERGDCKLAKKYLFETVDILKKYNNLYGLANGYISIGECFKIEENYEKSLEYYNKSLEISFDLEFND